MRIIAKVLLCSQYQREITCCKCTSSMLIFGCCYSLFHPNNIKSNEVLKPNSDAIDFLFLTKSRVWLKVFHILLLRLRPCKTNRTEASLYQIF